MALFYSLLSICVWLCVCVCVCVEFQAGIMVRRRRRRKWWWRWYEIAFARCRDQLTDQPGPRFNLRAVKSEWEWGQPWLIHYASARGRGPRWLLIRVNVVRGVYCFPLVKHRFVSYRKSFTAGCRSKQQRGDVTPAPLAPLPVARLRTQRPSDVDLILNWY